MGTESIPKAAQREPGRVPSNLKDFQLPSGRFSLLFTQSSPRMFHVVIGKQKAAKNPQSSSSLKANGNITHHKTNQG